MNKILITILFIFTIYINNYGQEPFTKLFFDIPVTTTISLNLSTRLLEDTSRFESNSNSEYYLKKAIYDKYINPDKIQIEIYDTDIEYGVYVKTDSLNSDSTFFCQDIILTFKYKKEDKEKWINDKNYMLKKVNKIDIGEIRNYRSHGFKGDDKKNPLAKFKFIMYPLYVHDFLFPIFELETRKYKFNDEKYSYEIIMIYREEI